MKKSLLYYLVVCMILLYSCQNTGTEQIYVSTTGEDVSEGTKSAPFRTLKRAKEEIEKQNLSGVDTVQIIVSEGVYYLDAPLVFEADKFGVTNTHYVIRAKEGENVVISGGKLLENLSWERYNDNVWKTSVENIDNIPSLYADKDRLIPARYPNYEEGVYPYGGYSKDALSAKRIATWSNPEGGYIHAMHQGKWGGMHYRITGKVGNDSLSYEGGWQNNRPSPMHPTQRFVENIFEELDAPGEWFFDKKERTLYYYPLEGENPEDMDFVAAHLESLIEFHGDTQNPVHDIKLEGLSFKHTVPTFMKTKEPLMRSDWAIYRKGAVFLEGTERIQILNNDFQLLGSNAVFVSGYNKNSLIEGNLIENIGGNGIAFVGKPDAVRSPSFQYDEFVPAAEMDTIAGPKSNNYPRDGVAQNNLIRNIGEIEKQVAGVEIQMASHIMVEHNTIYHVPRAGINIGDGAWGGHNIAYNDVFETVLETGDHGAFNAWGRDRFWHPNRVIMDSLVKTHPNWVKLDAKETTRIHDNRFRCDHGWDIDLDDGATNYEIYNNLTLNGGIKLREGFYRKVYNNTIINNGFHPHVWFENSHDEFFNNLVMTAHQPIGMEYWGDRVDKNFFSNEKDLKKSQTYGVDSNSTWEKPDFKDEKSGYFILSDTSSLIDQGFEKVDLSGVGVKSPRLQKIADSPQIPQLFLTSESRGGKEVQEWKGASIKSVETLGEQSATGLSEIKGILILAIKEESILRQAGLQKNDVILTFFGEEVNNPMDLQKIEAANKWKQRLVFTIWRNQKQKDLEVEL